MTTETSQLLCAVFAVTNILFYFMHDSLLNLCISIAMCVSVCLLELVRKLDA